MEFLGGFSAHLDMENTGNRRLNSWELCLVEKSTVQVRITYDKGLF